MNRLIWLAIGLGAAAVFVIGALVGWLIDQEHRDAKARSQS